MKLKMSEDGKSAVLQDGKPVYIHDDGREVPFDAPATVATISRLNGEAKTHREAKEAVEGKLKAFEGITDASAALKALETVKNLDEGQLVTAGKVEEIKRAARETADRQVQDAAKASATRIQELEGSLGKLTSQLEASTVTNTFANSKFVKEKIAVPVDMLQAMFGSRFKNENGHLVGYDPSGNKIYSPSRPGEVADFDEAMSVIVQTYPNRDSILKGTGAHGDGKQQNSGNNNNGGKTMTRTAYEQLDPVSRAVKIKEGVQLVEG